MNGKIAYTEIYLLALHCVRYGPVWVITTVY
jgi:hypothetical protein